VVRAALTTLAGLLIICSCRPGLEFPPRLATGPVSDTARLIAALPDSGAVNISKNGYRAFDLDAIVTDEDDADSTITWSFAPGPELEVRLSEDTAMIGPVPNSVCTSYVVFTATDPGGLSASRTCPISVFEFRILLDSVALDSGSAADTALGCDYRPDLKDGLVWDAPVYDPAWLLECSLVGSSGAKVLSLKAGDSVGVTGVYLTAIDPVNNVDFHHGIQVRIE
jgi:hypothetical protein